MSEIEATSLAVRLRRDLRLAACIRASSFAAFLGLFAAMYMVEGYVEILFVLLILLVVALWLWLTGKSIRNARLVSGAADLLAAGQFSEAEQNLTAAATGFSLFRNVKLLACLHLATLQYHRGRYEETAKLTRFMSGLRSRWSRRLRTPGRILLAEALVMLRELAAAGEVIAWLSQQNLSLSDRLSLLPLSLRYQWFTGATSQAVGALAEKVRLAELLDSNKASLVHLLLGAACQREKMIPESRYLFRRAALYADIDNVVSEFALPEEFRVMPAEDAYQPFVTNDRSVANP